MILERLVITLWLTSTAFAEWQMPLLMNKKQPAKSKFDEGVTYRLPNNTRPIHYDISISSGIHAGDFNFNGIVAVRIVAVESSSEITLHVKWLTIYNVDLFNADDQIIQSNVNFEHRERFEFLVITPSQQLLANQQYVLRVNYTGTLRNDDYGFFRTSYLHENGQLKWQATTQFQATDARHGFPCYDEPHIRTSFVINVRHHSTYHAVSNMPIESISPPDNFDFVTTTFRRITSMQTYLVVFTISDFVYVEDTSVIPPQRVYARESLINAGDAEFAMQVSPEILKFCEDYFGINYTFPKMDQVAMPQYGAVAMEHWGACSYGEPFLLYRHRVSTTFDREYIITLIMHEFVHQWIGNIVSPKWWNYLWINEGFATMQMYYLTDLGYPEERLDDTFVTGIIQAVFEIDADPNIRAMNHYVETPIDIINLFDWIAYSKAGSVLYMFMHAFTDATWKKGLNWWINERFYDSGGSEILFENIYRAVNDDHPELLNNLNDPMETWENQAGFPVITVSRSGNTLTISQERFMYDRNLQSDSIWTIPLNYVVGSNPNYSITKLDFWMVNKNMTLLSNTAPKPWGENDWLLFNIKATGYYRINYDKTLWQLLIDQLNAENEGFERIHYRNRAQLIDDAYNLARGKRLTYGILFNLMNYLWQEIDYIPWVPVSRAGSDLNRRLSGSEIYKDYQKFIRDIVAKLFNHLGVSWIDEENRTERYARSISVFLACQAQLPECLKASNHELNEHVSNGKWIATEYVGLIYCNGMRTANVLLFISMQNRLLRSTDTLERWNIIGGLACTQNVDHLAFFLNLAITPGLTHSFFERSRILTAPASNGEKSLITMIEFIEYKFAFIIEENPALLTNMLNSISWFIASESLYYRYVLLLSDLLCHEAITEEVFNHHLESARTNLDWQAKFMAPIVDFFMTRP